MAAVTIAAVTATLIAATLTAVATAVVVTTVAVAATLIAAVAPVARFRTGAALQPAEDRRTVAVLASSRYPTTCAAVAARGTAAQQPTQPGTAQVAAAHRTGAAIPITWSSAAQQAALATATT